MTSRLRSEIVSKGDVFALRDLDNHIVIWYTSEDNEYLGFASQDELRLGSPEIVDSKSLVILERETMSTVKVLVDGRTFLVTIIYLLSRCMLVT